MLQHVTLELRREDWPAAKEFWSIVGFEEVADDPVAPPEAHAAVVVENWDAVVARLQDEGYELDERPRHWGHRVELMAAPPS